MFVGEGEVHLCTKPLVFVGEGEVHLCTKPLVFVGEGGGTLVCQTSGVCE